MWNDGFALRPIFGRRPSLLLMTLWKVVEVLIRNMIVWLGGRVGIQGIQGIGVGGSG